MANTGKRRRSPRGYRLTAGSILILLLILASVGGAAAYLSYSTGAVTNTFAAETAIAPVIQEVFDGNSKEDVRVTVPELDHAVYVRAAVVITWQDTAGNVLGRLPVQDQDYAISYGSDWTRGDDGLWYYTKVLDKDTPTTANLIHSCTPISGQTPEGWGLNVQILAQTVQAVGTTDIGAIPAVQDAWGANVPLS